MKTNQPTGLIYRCPECGEFSYDSGEASYNTPMHWYDRMRKNHSDCGNPKEPPCPVMRHPDDSGLYVSRPKYPLREAKAEILTTYTQDAAVAIAFQHAVEEVLVVVMGCYGGEPLEIRYRVDGVVFNTPAAAVKAIWPETFKDLEVSDD